ncbi:hypothetical protein [Litchfieldia salsa]|uniref:Uncharacterized protein n=1 Tax=Litchfieldia salsa TaxID=930152 RepID=A0A1H0UAB4_9BACI|nr:hypothetical protein [Litchfieldia salsa]SDP63113.1 hypothetical protein SAMN05216565_104263 [Litchfieldia salsa]
MGYIMPVQQNTYTQYANRRSLHNYNYAHINTTSAMKLNSKYVEEEKSHETRRFSKILEGMKNSKTLTMDTSQYTGKGTQFNQIV